MKESMWTGLLSVIIVAILTVGAAMAEGKGVAGLPPAVQEMIAKAKASVPKVSAAQVKAAMDNNEKAVYLDVRDGEEFSAGHLPGAINISRGTLEMHVFGKIPDQNAKIYVYCKTTARSALATKTLRELGYKNVFLIDASFEDWIRAGYPVVR